MTQTLEELRERYAIIQQQLAEEGARTNPSARVLYALQQDLRECGIQVRDLEHPSTVPPGRRIVSDRQ